MEQLSRKILIQTDEQQDTLISVLLTMVNFGSGNLCRAQPGIKIPMQLIDSKLSIVGSKPVDSEKVYNIIILSS